MKRLVLVRHGESAWNVEHRIQGQLGEGLSRRGRLQVGVTAQFLAQTYPHALLVASDLLRCRETVAPLEAILERPARLDQGLRERDWGVWSGELAEDLLATQSERWGRWQAGEDVIGEVGGEDTPTFTSRIVTTLERLIDEVPDDGDLVCITHGGPVWHGTSALLDLHVEALGGVGNASVTEILVDEELGRRLGGWNQISHLPVELRTALRRIEPARR
jgi:broad specificity phosphatase PhoE